MGSIFSTLCPANEIREEFERKDSSFNSPTATESQADLSDLDFMDWKMLSKGSYGEAFSATHQQTGKVWAIKKIHRTAVDLYPLPPSSSKVEELLVPRSVVIFSAQNLQSLGSLPNSLSPVWCRPLTSFHPHRVCDFAHSESSSTLLAAYRQVQQQGDLQYCRIWDVRVTLSGLQCRPT